MAQGYGKPSSSTAVGGLMSKVQSEETAVPLPEIHGRSGVVEIAAAVETAKHGIGHSLWKHVSSRSKGPRSRESVGQTAKWCRLLACSSCLPTEVTVGLGNQRREIPKRADYFDIRPGYRQARGLSDASAAIGWIEGEEPRLVSCV